MCSGDSTRVLRNIQGLREIPMGKRCSLILRSVEQSRVHLHDPTKQLSGLRNLGNESPVTIVTVLGSIVMHFC